MSFLFETLAWVDNNYFFQQHLKVACDLLPLVACACFLPFEQLIGQQMVQLQDSILKHLHHHTFSNKTFKVHCAQNLSCFIPRANFWLTTQLVFPTFRLSSLFFCKTLCTWLGLPHFSIASILQCVCIDPINLMGIHFLCCAHNNERIRTDPIHDAFVTIAQDVGFHMGRK
jgi:hypothetical protein